MSQSAVLSHNGTVPVTLAELEKLPQPKPQGPRHQPVKHALFVNELRKQIAERGYIVHREQLSLDHNGVRMFGALDMVPAGAEKLVGKGDTTEGMSVGLRHANDRTLSVGLIAGARVFVCDNMAFVGDMVLLRRKHTTNMDLPIEIHDALDRLFEKYQKVEDFNTKLKNVDVNDTWARDVIYKAFLDEKLLAVGHLPTVHGWYFEPPAGAIDVQTRTAWGLYNSFTRVIKDLAPYRQQDTTVDVSNFFTRAFNLN